MRTIIHGFSVAVHVDEESCALPFLYLAIRCASDGLVRPVGAARPMDISKGESERDLGTVGCDRGDSASLAMSAGGKAYRDSWAVFRRAKLLGQHHRNPYPQYLPIPYPC